MGSAAYSDVDQNGCGFTILVCKTHIHTTTHTQTLDRKECRERIRHNQKSRVLLAELWYIISHVNHLTPTDSNVTQIMCVCKISQRQVKKLSCCRSH